MPKEKDPAKIEAIHRAAMDQVIRTGFAGLRMADVAKAAEVATGTLYVYYASKEALINEVFVETKKEIAAVLLDPAHATPTIEGSFRKMWIAYFNFCLRNPEKMMFVEQFLYSGLITDDNIALTDALFEPLDQFLKQGQQAGILKKMEVTLLKSQMQGALHEIVRGLIRDGKARSRSAMDHGFAMAWDSVRK